MTRSTSKKSTKFFAIFMAKKFLIIISLALIFTCCCACNKQPGEGKNPITTNDNDVTTSSSEVNDKTSSIYVGMTYDEFVEKHSDTSYQQYSRYIFFVNSNGENVVIKFSGDGKRIEKFEKYTAVSPKSDDFYSLKKEMTIFEVVKKVGAPFRSVTSGLFTLDFKSSTGEIYRINWSDNNKENTIKLIEVSQIDDKNHEIIKTIIS